MPERVAPRRSRCSRSPMEKEITFLDFQGLTRKLMADKIQYQQYTQAKFSVRLFELFEAQKAHKLKSWQYFVFG